MHCSPSSKVSTYVVYIQCTYTVKASQQRLKNAVDHLVNSKTYIFTTLPTRWSASVNFGVPYMKVDVQPSKSCMPMYVHIHSI